MEYSKKTGLSAGTLLRSLLLASEEIAGTVTDIFPCIAPEEDTKLPYIQYQCTGMDTTDVKSGRPIARMNYAVTVYAEDYDTAIALCEAVVGRVSGVRYTAGDIYISGIKVTNFTEVWAGDSYGLTLQLTLTTNQI